MSRNDTMDKWTAARTLDEISRYLELSDANRFKSQAFERAARAIEKLDVDFPSLVRSPELYKTPGIGKAIGPILVELVETGKSKYLEDLREQFPPGVFDLLRVPSLGLKKIGQLYTDLGIASIPQLADACRSGALSKLKGFGPKTAQKILSGIEFAQRNESRFLLPIGIEVAESLRERLASFDDISDVEIAGSVRRRLEVIRNVNLAIAAPDPRMVMEAIRRAGILEHFEQPDERTVRGMIRNEVAAFLHFSLREDFGTNLLVATGSATFLESFSDHIAGDGYAIVNGVLQHKGRHVSTLSERELFKTVGLAFVDPERREDGSDLRKKRRTKLVDLGDLRGTFHIHTTYSDGRNSVSEMMDAAIERGFEYAGISDHSKAAYYAGGLSEAQLDVQHADIGAYEKNASIRIFRGTEADILGDGRMDYDDETMQRFDFVIASVHSNFKMGKDEMTERILRALDNPFVTFIGHLTGRLLLSRDGYSVDYDRIFEKAAQRGVMIEINGNPRRLDVDWRHIGRAVDRGVIFSIHPDAHSIREYNALVSGTWVARKAGLSRKNIFNTLGVEEVAAFLSERKKRALLPSHARGEGVPQRGTEQG